MEMPRDMQTIVRAAATLVPRQPGRVARLLAGCDGRALLIARDWEATAPTPNPHPHLRERAAS